MANMNVHSPPMNHIKEATSLAFERNSKDKFKQLHLHSFNRGQSLLTPLKRRPGRPKKMTSDLYSTLRNIDSIYWNDRSPYSNYQKYDNSIKANKKFIPLNTNADDKNASVIENSIKKPKLKSILKPYLTNSTRKHGNTSREKKIPISDTKCSHSFSNIRKEGSGFKIPDNTSSLSVQNSGNPDEKITETLSNFSSTQSSMISEKFETATAASKGVFNEYSSSDLFNKIYPHNLISNLGSTESACMYACRTLISRGSQSEYPADDKYCYNSLLCCSKKSSVDHHHSTLETSLIFRLLPQVEAAICAGLAAGLSGPHSWTPGIVASVISALPGCERLAQVFVDNEIDGLALLCLNQHDLMSTLKLKLGPSKKVLSAIRTFRQTLMFLPNNDCFIDHAAVLEAVTACFPARSNHESIISRPPAKFHFENASSPSAKSVSYNKYENLSLPEIFKSELETASSHNIGIIDLSRNRFGMKTK